MPKSLKSLVSFSSKVVMKNRNKWSTLESVGNGLESVRVELWQSQQDSNNRTAALRKLFNKQINLVSHAVLNVAPQ